jgi:hypothetical protein
MDEQSLSTIEESLDMGVDNGEAHEPGSTGIPAEKSKKTKGSTRKRIILIAGGFFIMILLCAGYFSFTSDISEELRIGVRYPGVVEVGDQFKLTLSLTNTGEEALTVESIQLWPAVSSDEDSILAGAQVISTEPEMGAIDVPGFKFRSYSYLQNIGPGEAQQVVFNFQAVKSGEFHTDVDVYLTDSWTSAPGLVLWIAP